MKLKINQFDLWVFCKKATVSPKYLLLQTSQEKADRWFKGGRFWQILGGEYLNEETVPEGICRVMGNYGLEPLSAWAVEHTYTFFNIRRMDLEIMPVFAAEVAETKDVVLSWEHSEFAWLTAKSCLEKVHFRGLRDGLKLTRRYVSEVQNPLRELQIL